MNRVLVRGSQQSGPASRFTNGAGATTITIPMAAPDAHTPSTAKSDTLRDDPDFERALSEVQRALDEQHVVYVDTAPLIRALLQRGPLELKRVGEIAGLDPSEVNTGLARLQDLGMVSHADTGGSDLISLTAVGIAAAG